MKRQRRASSQPGLPAEELGGIKIMRAIGPAHNPADGDTHKTEILNRE